MKLYSGIELPNEAREIYHKLLRETVSEFYSMIGR
jgi:hypothetical protein